MRRCDYCAETVSTERELLEHLRDEHADELGSIDRRRVASLDSGANTGPLVYAAALGAVVLVGLVAYLVFFTGGSDGVPTPHSNGAVHYHGGIDVTIDGRTLDFSRPEYQIGQTNDQHFHFERGNGDLWHVHSRDVTLAYGMQSLGIDVTEDAVTFEGTTYRDADPGTSVTVTVNGDPVTPNSYVLREGDTVRILVTTDG